MASNSARKAIRMIPEVTEIFVNSIAENISILS